MPESNDHSGGGDLVILARCADTIEASSLRMFLDSRGLYCLVQGEHHAGGGGFGELPEVNVLVREADLDEAARLLALFQQGTPAVEEEQEPEEAPPPPKRAKRPRPAEGRRYDKRIGVVIIVSLALTFGCGHFYAGARKRGLGLLLLELVGGAGMFSGQAWGGALVCACIFADMIGASVFISRRRAELSGAPPGSKWPGRVALGVVACGLLGAAGFGVAQFIAERRHQQLLHELGQLQFRCDRSALWLENGAPVAQRIALPRVTTSSTPIRIILAFDFDPAAPADVWPIELLSPGPFTVPAGGRLKVSYALPKSGPCAGANILTGTSCSGLVADLNRLDDTGAVEASAVRSCRVE